MRKFQCFSERKMLIMVVYFYICPSHLKTVPHGFNPNCNNLFKMAKCFSTKTKIPNKNPNPKKRWITLVSQTPKEKTQTPTDLKFFEKVEVKKPWPKTCCAKRLRSFTLDFDGSDTTSERPLGKQTFNVTTGPTIRRMSNLREGKVEESWVFCSFFVPDFIPCLFQSHCVCS